jgi:hypothetical protein
VTTSRSTSTTRKYARITNYVRDLAVRVADLDHRVAVDKPKPDPNGECRQ